MSLCKSNLDIQIDRLKNEINSPEGDLDEIVYNRMLDFVTKHQKLIDDSIVTLSCVEGCITLGFPPKRIYIDFPPLSEENCAPIEIFKFNYSEDKRGRIITETEFVKNF